MIRLYSVLTQNCNLKCTHCYIPAGPGNKDKTMSLDNFEEVIKNLPANESVDLCLTGGEIFTVEEQLWGYLEIIKKQNKKREYKITPKVQTNGFWMTNPDAKSKVDKMREYGVGELDIPSADYFHVEQGYHLNSANLREKLLDKIKFEIRGAQKVMPVGRARSLFPNQEYNFNCSEQCRWENTFTMNWEGKVSRCCYGFFGLEGNVIEEPLQELIGKDKQSKVVNKLVKSGIAEVASHYGMSNEEIRKRWNEKNNGGFCCSLFEDKIIEDRYKRIFD